MAQSLTHADVARLLAEPSASVRAELADKVAREIDNTQLSYTELEIAQDIVRAMARDVELTVRRTLSNSLRRAKNLPNDVAVRLAGDVEAVALPILGESPVLTDADLVEIVQHGSARKHEAIAARADVSEPVADALVNTAGEAAVAVLLENATAHIAEASLGLAIDRFAESDRVKAGIVHRTALPVTISERLLTMVSDKLQAYLVSHHELPVSLATDIVLEGRERALLHISLGSSAQELERLVRQMHRNRRLTPLLVLRALCLGDLAFFEAAMAAMAKVPVTNARILIHDAGRNGLTSLYERAGMPPRLLPAVRVAVEVVRGTEFDGGERDHERYRSRVITRILTQFEDLPQEDLDYLLDKLGDVLTVAGSSGAQAETQTRIHGRLDGGGGHHMKSADFVVNGQTRLAAVKRFPVVEFADYERRLATMQDTLQLVQQAYLGTSHHAVIVMEGWDTAGKGGIVRRLGWALDPRSFKVHAIAAPSGREKSLHYLQRFWEQLPQHGQIVVFDRSWYGRVLVERVESFATSAEWHRAYDEINAFERTLLADGARLVKLFLHITPEEQMRRFRARLTDPLKRWKLSYEDFRNRARWKDYEAAIEDMMEKTSSKRAPWHLIPANNKPFGRLAAFRVIADRLSRGVTLEPRELDPKVADAAQHLLGIKLPEAHHRGR